MNTLEKNAAYYAQLFFIQQEDLTLARTAGTHIHTQKNQLYQQLYAWMKSHPYFGEYYTADVLQAIIDNEDTFWEDLVLVSFSDEYIVRQQYIGEIFANVGIPFDACLAIWSCYGELVKGFLLEQQLFTAALADAFHKLMKVAIALVMDGYNNAMNAILQEKNASLSQMSTPVAQLWDNILLLPIVGFMDSKRAQEVMYAVLHHISQTQAKAFILDIGGVETMDTAIANHLIKVSKATRLMGCSCILSGISASVAQTMVELGVQIDEIETVSTLQEGLKRALKITATQIV